DQPEPGGREASGPGGQPMEDRPVRTSPERSADRAVETDPRVDEGDPLRRDDPAGRWSVGIIGEVRPEPPFGCGYALTEPAGVVLDLVLPDPADVEVAGGRVRKVDARDARGREHRAMLGQLHADLASAHEVEQPPLEHV